ncbi:hypothetical protein AB6A40_006229 [Gnathostoma spinigerum]|uniref:PDZ domain-containing protein n=1 Tax=Gnathostoma spinigerum TaxID=75299 RepID=A0ABD6EHR3_9BILA
MWLQSIGCQIRVHHVECLRDGGILDPDDRLFDVFDEGIDQILAIYDENEAKNDAKNVVQNRGQTAACSSRLGEYNVRNGKKSDSTDQIDAESCSSTRDFVEITNLSEPPHDGLLVSTNEEYVRQQEPSSSSSINAFARKEDFPCSVDQKAGVLLSSTDDKLPKRHKARPRVTISPDVDYRKSSLGDDQIEMTEQATSSSSRLARSNARKSRITDAFFEAQERLEANKSTTTVSPCVRPSLTDASKLIPPVPGVTPGQTVIVLSDATMHRSVGIEIVAVQDPTNSLRLRSVEITNIDSEGRVGVDGRIKVGDCITEINQRPVYQMSVSRARAYLHELQSCAHPSLTIDRPFETFIAEASAVGISHQSEASSSSLQTKPIFSALQQANTTAIGATSSVEITKNPSGFGFTLTSRDTAKGERLFYIGTVKPGGAAIGLLRAGDRILEINGVSTTGLQQQDLVTRLKALQVGEKVRILLSRIASDSADPENTGHLKGFKDRSGGLDKTRAGLDQAPRERASEDIEKNEKDREKKEHTKRTEVHCFDIALNDSGSAGLGISLKARAVMRPDGTRQDCGIFIKKVLHGGAAYKDGRLRINDRLIGIEDVDLISLKHNSEASEAITKCLKGFGASATSVRLRISRKPSEEAVANLPSSRESFDDTVVSGNLDMKASSGNVQTSKGHFTSPSSSKAGVREAVERRSSVTSGKDDSTLQAFASEEEESNLDDDVFSRENPTRRSMSEKRHMGAADPSHTLVYQKIKHCRQTSGKISSVI